MDIQAIRIGFERQYFVSSTISFSDSLEQYVPKPPAGELAAKHAMQTNNMLKIWRDACEFSVKFREYSSPLGRYLWERLDDVTLSNVFGHKTLKLLFTMSSTEKGQLTVELLVDAHIDEDFQYSCQVKTCFASESPITKESHFYAESEIRVVGIVLEVVQQQGINLLRDVFDLKSLTIQKSDVVGL